MSSRDLVVAAAGASAPSDPQFKNVSLLLSGDGTNGAQNNTFLDSSTNNFTITRNGNTTQGTFSPYGNLWSNYFDGSGDYLALPSSSSLALGSGDFCIELWAYIQGSVNSQNGLIGNASTAGTNNYQIDAYLNKFRFGSYSGNVITGSSTIYSNTWYHVVVCRSGTSLALFVNGVRDGTATSTQNYSSTDAVNIARTADGFAYVNGYISNVRIVKGSSVYNPSLTTLTVPTTPLTSVSGTSLLTCQSNHFIDNSSNNFTLTVNGNTSVQRFSPFNPTAPYSASTIGGSGYFDGTGDYLNTTGSSLAAAGDFTFECWAYITNTSTQYQGIFSTRTEGGSGLTINKFDTVFEAVINTTAIGTSPIIYNSWVHLAIARSGTGSNNIAFWVNGTRVATITNTASTGSTNAALGRFYTNINNYYLGGYIADARMVNGTAVYNPASTTITVPTAPLTAITNTSLLCNFTNAGIPDAAMMNDLETVGNAQVSTSVKKYGTGSLYFDGVDDRLPMATSPNLSFGTGDFTVEFWMYSNDVSGGTQRGIIQTSDTVGGLKTTYTTGIAILQGSNSTGGILNGGIAANVAGTFVGSNTASITTGTWYHIALVRSSGTSKLYVNGTSIASVTTTGNCSGQNCVVGGYYSTDYLYNGYIDDLRITKGYARYTANFTPPTAALPTY